MATENTQNNSAQTLFRFVSLRNPQLTTTKKENLGFILRPANLSSAFDNLVNPNDSALVKFQALERAAKEFNPVGYETELIIETGALSEVLKIGRKIAKRETLTTLDENTAKSLYNSSNIQGKVAAVWDNLMYQTVTEKNFYVKEALVHILKALHFGYVCGLPSNEELTKINGEDLKAKALEARVVLPMKFFGDGYEGEGSDSGSGSGSTNNAFQVNVSRIGEGVINGSDIPLSIQYQLKAEGDKISELSALNFEKDGLTKLKSELQKIQIVYVKAKNKAYEKAYADYKEQYKDEIDAYNAQLKHIRDQITEDMTQEEIDALYETLQPLEIPPFEFIFKDQLNFEDFKAKLSLDSLKLFVNIFTEIESGEIPADGLDFTNITVLSDRKLKLGNVVVEMTDFYDTYVEVFEKLDEKSSENTQLLFQKSPLQEQKFLNLGNVLIPVSNSRSNLSQIISRTYYLKASYDTLAAPASMVFYYQAESNSYGLGSAKILATTDLGVFEETYSNIGIVDNKVTFPPILVNKFGKLIRSLRIQVFFNNGEQAIVEYTDLTIGESYTNILYSEKETTEEPEEGGGQTPQPGTFFPKHFGVKRLGIADYLKVVQSVHAYIPGEVSNIENVMASELRHKSSVSRDYSETIDTTSESIETEKISDTSKAERNEMQTEVAKELDKQQSIEAHTSFTAGGKLWTLEVGGSYANNSAQHDSTRQAVSKSQELTERAMERVLTKINKERVQKIIKEFTETNVHEFDNRGKVGGDAPQHITGVYRWVDKKMKNQIYNYGKRTMFEFMIPEPAQLHRLAMAATSTEMITAPIDPRIAPVPQTMKDAKTATLDQLQYWASYYSVKLTELIEATKKFTTGVQWIKLNGDGGYKHLNIDIPTNYQASHVKMWYGYERNRPGGSGLSTSNFSGGMAYFPNSTTSIDATAEFTPQNVTGSYDFVYQGSNIDSVNFNFEVTCKLSDAYMNAWKQENFDAIIKAYQDAYAAFLEKQKELEAAIKEQEAENQEKVSTFYRDMENVILKHNCIAFLLQDYSALGKVLTNKAKTMQDFSVILGDDLDQYTALAKFMEQAFEWSIMDYTFYPYYWANREEWQKMYLSNSTDPLFRSFLQAGMARVIVTVNPGFEDAVQFFLTTGRIWNGGEVPVIGDPMYMSIVDELRQPTGEPQGKYWITRIPTTLTILQAESVGLKVNQPLPIFPEDHPENCENPKDLEFESSFFKEDLRMEAGDQDSTLAKAVE